MIVSSSAVPCARCASPLRPGARHCPTCLLQFEDARAPVQALLGDDYVIVAVVGDAGYGVRFHARSRQSGRDLLLTLVDPAVDEEAHARLRERIASQPARHHRGLLAVEAVLEVDEAIFLVSPWRPMVSVAQQFPPDTQMEPADLLHMLHGVAGGLRMLHRRERAHGAIAPDTVCVEEDGNGVAIEPGVVPALFGPHPPAAFAPYTAPELWRGGAPTARSDQYALGALTFRLLTGRPAFQAATAQEMAHLHEAGLVPPLFVLRPGLAAEVDVAIRRAMAKDPAHRFPSVEAFVEALARGAGTPWRLAEEPEVQEPRRRLSILGAVPVVLGAVVLLAAAGYAVPETRPTVLGAWRKLESGAYATARTLASVVPGGEAIRRRLTPPPVPVVAAAAAGARAVTPSGGGTSGGGQDGSSSSSSSSTSSSSSASGAVARAAASAATVVAPRQVTGGQQEEAPEVPADQRYGYLRVNGTGEVRVNGRYVGSAPLVTRVPVGLHIVTLTRDGSPVAPGSFPVAVTEDDTSTARFLP